MIIVNTVEKNDLSRLGADEKLVHDVTTNKLYFQKFSVEDKGEVVGISLARVTTEMTLLVNAESNIRNQKIINLLLAEQVMAARGLGINQTHVWTDIDSNLMTHYGFKERQQRSYILHF